MRYRRNSVEVYLAGSLFNHKDLTGNLLLAGKIGDLSNGRYRFILPQDVGSDKSDLSIKEADILHLVEAQAVLFNFDGSDLDSGTVAEFMMSVFLGIPSLLLRTDFRAGGDNPSGDPWNLMCSGYSGTQSLLLNSMDLYQQVRGGKDADIRTCFQTGADLADRFYDELARPIIERLEALLSEPPRFKNSEEAFEIYRYFIHNCTESLPNVLSDEAIRNILARRFLV